MADKFVWHVLSYVLRMNRLMPNPSPPSKSESGHYWWYMCDAIYTSWFCGECSDKRRARLVFFSRLSWPLLGFVLVWSLKETRYRERVPSHLRSGEAVASAAGATHRVQERGMLSDWPDAVCLYFTFSLATAKQKKLRTSASVDIWYGGFKHARCVCGNCSSFTHFGKCFPDYQRRINGGRWVLVDSSIICIDERSLFWRYG